MIRIEAVDRASGELVERVSCATLAEAEDIASELQDALDRLAVDVRVVVEPDAST